MVRFQGTRFKKSEGLPMLSNKLLAVGAVIAGLMMPAQAMAQYEAYTRVDLNLRVGPSTDYGVIDVIPSGDPVDVLGCLNGIEWCDVEWYGLRGWVAARYLVQPGTSVYLPQVYASIGLPFISFSFDTYHDRHYRHRPWYKKRHGHWRGRDFREARRPRSDDREERQETERPRKRQETERPRQRRDAERPRQQRTERPRQQRETERPRQRQEAERPRQDQQQAEPRQGERTQQSRQTEPIQGQGPAPSGPSQELEYERGQ
jgi:uncharacterized protein YraI